MKLRPTIFLSGVSSEFGSFRDAVEIEVQKKGCFAENQSSFGVDYHTVEEMLRRRISDADAVIHIVGFCFGAEPKDRPADKPRRSYTQMEYDIARELEKPVYVFLSSDAAISDAMGADDAEATALQLAHRQAIQSSNPLFYFFKDKSELCNLAGEIEAVAHADFRVDISRIDKYAPAELIGREDELALLNDAWLKVRRGEARRPHLLTFVALGGEGKTSLVAKWLANLAYENWPGCDSVFAWSFYSQGTREQYASSSDLFLKEAITFFGNDADKEFAASAAAAYEKGQRLARILARRRALLILDGLEPLQYAPTSPTPGELKDLGAAALLKGLAAVNNSLCIVTSRYSLPNLRAYWQTTAPEIPLMRLSLEAGVYLLKTLRVNGSRSEFETLVEDVKGHALTLNLLGTYLQEAHGGDIRRRDLIKLEEADAEEQSGHAFRVIEAYERAFELEDDKGKQAVAILRLLGLFDRPINANCFAVLQGEPVITGLTEPLVGLKEAQLNLVFKRLEAARLLTVNWGPGTAWVSLDTHPLVREYFASQLWMKQDEAWRAAHRRLYEHLCATTSDRKEPSLEDLQPLYQAVVHGCHAGLHQDACVIYRDRILRGRLHYSLKKLGAVGSNLGAVACFFKTPWTELASGITEFAQTFLLNEAAFHLHAMGRLIEALDLQRTGVERAFAQGDWNLATVTLSNLSQLELTLGKVTEAIGDAERSVIYADRTADLFQQVTKRSGYAAALHEAGDRIRAEALFREAERMQAKMAPRWPLLYSLQGFLYCELLLTKAERATWQEILNRNELSQTSGSRKDTKQRGQRPVQSFELSQSKVLLAVSSRAAETLKWSKRDFSTPLLDYALHHLTLGRANLYRLVLARDVLRVDSKHAKLKGMIDDAVGGFRGAGAMHHLAAGLLSRACLRFLSGVHAGDYSAQEDLNEAWEIAERGPMKLHMTDIHLYRARLFFREVGYPWESPQADLEAAEKLINECGYHRRDEELADAKRVILERSA